MSGLSQVDFRSDYYQVRTESAWMNFAFNPEVLDQEQRWRRDWTEKGARRLERVKRIFQQRFAMLDQP